MNFMENKLFYAGLLFMGFGVLGKPTAFAFGFVLFLVDMLKRAEMLSPLTQWVRSVAKDTGKYVAECLSGRKGEFAKSFSRISLYVFTAVMLITVARIWQNGFTLFLGVVGTAMIWLPPIAFVIHLASKFGWKMMNIEEKEKRKETT